MGGQYPWRYMSGECFCSRCFHCSLVIKDGNRRYTRSGHVHAKIVYQWDVLPMGRWYVKPTLSRQCESLSMARPKWDDPKQHQQE